MRKQVDFIVRVWDFGNGANGSKTGEMVSKEIRELYLNNGYEIFSTPGALQVSAGVIYFCICFVKYEEESVLGGLDDIGPTLNVKSK